MAVLGDHGSSQSWEGGGPLSKPLTAELAMGPPGPSSWPTCSSWDPLPSSSHDDLVTLEAAGTCPAWGLSSPCSPQPLSLASLCRVQLPFSQSGVLIQQSSSYTKVEARLGLVLMWNHDDSLLVRLVGVPVCTSSAQELACSRGGRRCPGPSQARTPPHTAGESRGLDTSGALGSVPPGWRWLAGVTPSVAPAPPRASPVHLPLMSPPLQLELDAKYANKTCGLCGDFNGLPGLSELLPHSKPRPARAQRAPPPQ
ncbi:hypothetical protein P7K49_040211 [Saguinus oedipus]|uniref:VWFD domain-containing protein n=1 Tax=Saguinus oedipus TaxID=9490 RepID=A0ABQ9T8S2_SAGOE|nr:hypothetical protein P7K49_040211 [Saguinus oedipus]